MQKKRAEKCLSWIPFCLRSLEKLACLWEHFSLKEYTSTVAAVLPHVIDFAFFATFLGIATRSALSMNSVNSKAAQELVDSGTANPGTNTPAAPSAGGPTAQNTSGGGGGVTGPGGKTIRKASTRDCLETANIPGTLFQINLNRGSVISAHNSPIYDEYQTQPTKVLGLL